MKSFILSGKQSQFIDHYCINEIKIPSLVLMERAAFSVARVIKDELCIGKERRPSIAVVCNTGNNGADGVAAARILDDWGYFVKIIIIGNLKKATQEFITQINIVNHTDIEVDFAEEGTYDFTGFDVIVDGIFGIGLLRDVEGKFADMIDCICKSKCKVVSIDIPTGLSADTGRPLGRTVAADFTVTFGYLKLGHKLLKGRDYCGKIFVCDIGFRKEAICELLKKENVRYIYDGMEGCKLPVRWQSSNKGSYGKTAVVAGLGGMLGAAFFSAKAAYKTGCGLVKVLSIKENKDILMSMLPEAIYVEMDEGSSTIKEILENLVRDCRALVIGPGLGISESSYELVKAALELKMPVVFDADALNIISRHRDLLKKLCENHIVTPHILEMSRLMNVDKSEIIHDIVLATEDFVKQYGCTCVLKDSTTVVASIIDSKIQTYVNVNGNSAMATGGSGDVLSGMIGGFLSQKMKNHEAAELGVFLHGKAGDVAADKMSQYSVTASDIIDQIPGAFLKVVTDSIE